MSRGAGLHVLVAALALSVSLPPAGAGAQTLPAPTQASAGHSRTAQWAAVGPTATPQTPQRFATSNTSSLALNPARPVLSLLAGIGSAAVGGVIGAAAMAAVCPRRSTEWGCFSAGVAGFYSGALISFPIAAYVVGHALHGRGSFLLTVALPWVFAIAGMATVFSSDFELYARREGFLWEQPALYVFGGAAAMTSSLVLYELTSAWNARRRATGLQPIALRAHVQPHAAGVSLTGQL